MSLRVWLPLVNDLNNYGSSDLVFSIQSSTYSIIDNAGKLGKCLYNISNDSFHATGGAISDKPIDLGQNQSMFCWFKFASLTSASSLGGCIMSQHRYATCTGMGITIAYVDSTHGYISVNTGDGVNARTYNTYKGSTLLSADTWYHGGYTYDGTTLRLYINGYLDGEFAISNMAVPSDYLMLASWSLAGESGGVIYDGGYKFDGRINDARFYDHCLSIKEIKEIAKGLIVHYPLDGGNRILPPEYQELEYIESSGSSWINTGYTFSPETDSCKVIFKGNQTSNSGMVFASQSSTRYFWVYYYGYASAIRIYADNGSGQQLAGSIGADVQKHVVEYEDKTFYANGTAIGSLTGTFTSDDYPIYLFSWGETGTNYPFIGRMYSASIERDGKLQKLYVPAKRLSDSVAGMYELVSGEFLPSISGTNFTAGPTINDLTVYDTSGFKYNSVYNSISSVTPTNDTPRYNLAEFFGAYNTPKTDMTDAASLLPTLTNCTISWWEYCTTDGNTLVFTGDTTSKYIGAGNSSNKLYDQGIGTSSIMYRDGVLVTTTYEESSPPATHHDCYHTQNEWHHFVMIGVDFSSWTQFHINSYGATWSLNAYLSDVRIYATPLSADDVKELYQSSSCIDNTGKLYAYQYSEV